MNADTFWANVKPLIKASKTTQEGLAKACGISFGTFQGWIARHTLPDAVSAYRIAQALNTSVEYLVSGKEPENSKAVILDDLQAFIDTRR